MMAEGPEITVDIMYDDDEAAAAGAEAARLRAAQLRTRTTLTMWRSRFTTPAIDKEYQIGEDGTAHVHSVAPEQVMLDRTHGDNRRKVYYYDDSGASPDLVVEAFNADGTPNESPQDMASAYEALSAALFAVERVEMRR